MNRDALVIYLRDVRDLEVARYRLQQLDEESERTYQAKLAELERAGRHVEEPEEPAIAGYVRFLVGFAIFFVVLAAVCLAILPLVGALLFVPAAGILLMVLACLPQYRRESRQYKEGLSIARAINRVADANAADRERERREALAAREAAKRAYGDELAKAETLLQRYYAMDVVPAVYRSLVPVCYVYDYMSTSQASFEDALLHEHMENGFQRLEAKLDQVIAAVNSLIYETRVLRAENRVSAEAQADRERQMLQSLQATEQNTLAAAQYAELVECNTAACAYFELATYLKD